MSGYNSFEEYVAKVASSLPVSQPIFEAAMDEHNLYFELKTHATIDIDSISDPIEKLIATESSESFDRSSPEMGYQRGCSPSAIYHKITHCVIAVYEHNCGLKNPRSSRMYKWLDSMYNKYNDETHKGFVALYRYIAQHADVSSRRFAENGRLDQAHVNNVIAVLERMRNKYEDK